MSNKKFILNADDFGMSKAVNLAVLKGYNDGFLKSASLCANGKAFLSAVDEILPECPNLSIGVHLNIVEDRPLTQTPLLINKEKEFKYGFGGLLLKSKKSQILQEIEQEFRAQIERVQKYTQVDHIDSHVHTHAIPEIFKITAKLAKEYNIPYIRTWHEDFYIVPNIFKHLNFIYPLNILKIIVLNYFTAKNKKTLEEYNLKTNDFIIGVGYTGLMDDMTVEYGLKTIKSGVAEGIIHPSADKKSRRYKEFEITQNRKLEYTIKRLGFEITNHASLRGA